MTELTKIKTIGNKNNTDIFKDYPWFYSNIYEQFFKLTNKFFQHEFDLRFIGVSCDENMLFYGDEYFVSKIPINKSADFKIKISSDVIAYLLDIAVGKSDKKFKLQKLTDIEAMLIKHYGLFVYRKIQECLNKIEVSKQAAQEAKNINFIFFVRNQNIHIGKIIVSVPEFVLPDTDIKENKDRFSIMDFRKMHADIDIGVGKTKLALNDIKAIEEGDIILLEDSNINNMFINWDENEVEFKITPNPSLIISIDNNGGKEMEEETSKKSQNMWDSILVDVVAEFDNVKLTLGELKQISEGLVIDVGSVYDNKVKLRVENQVVASGELVILNDRYGVRVDKVEKIKEEDAPAPAKKTEPKPQAAKPASPKVPGKAKAAPAKEGDENFDYSDFEIEDESI